MRTLPVAALLLLASALPLAAQGSRHLSTRLTPPERVAGFRLTSIRQMEGGAGGHMRYRIADAGLELDAFLYPLPDLPDCERACDSVAVAAETDAFPGTIPALVAGGEFDSLAVDGDEPVRVEQPGVSAHGRHLRLAGAAGGKPVRSHLLVYGIGSYLVKVRATFPPGARRDSLTALFAREFVRSTLQPVAGSEACATGPADPEDIRLTRDARAPAAELRARVAPVLAGLGLTPDPSVTERDTWRTLPLRGWPAGIDYGAWARDPSPGFLVGVVLEERAGAARVTVSARALCAPTSATEDPRALEPALELRTVSEVLRALDPRPARP